MAIDNMQGKVTTTGMVDKMPKMPEGNVNPSLPQQQTVKQTPEQIPVEKENTTTFQGNTNLTDEDMDT